jgi:hypothetical protein
VILADTFANLTRQFCQYISLTQIFCATPPPRYNATSDHLFLGNPFSEYQKDHAKKLDRFLRCFNGPPRRTVLKIDAVDEGWKTRIYQRLFGASGRRLELPEGMISGGNNDGNINALSMRNHGDLDALDSHGHDLDALDADTSDSTSNYNSSSTSSDTHSISADDNYVDSSSGEEEDLLVEANSPKKRSVLVTTNVHSGSGAESSTAETTGTGGERSSSSGGEGSSMSGGLSNLQSKISEIKQFKILFKIYDIRCISEVSNSPQQ